MSEDFYDDPFPAPTVRQDVATTLADALAGMLLKPVAVEFSVDRLPFATLRGPLVAVTTSNPDEWLTAAMRLHFETSEGIRLAFPEDRVDRAERVSPDRVVVETRDRIRVEISDLSPDGRLAHWNGLVHRQLRDTSPGGKRMLHLWLSMARQERDTAEDPDFRARLDRLVKYAVAYSPPPPPRELLEDGDDEIVF